MARTSLLDTMLASVLVMGLVVLSAARNVKYPTECPKVDSKNETIQLPYETDCTKYYMCSGGKKHLMECGPSDNEGGRLYFNPVKHVCDWPFNVDCKQGQPSVRVATFAKILLVPTECPAHESMEFTVDLPDENDCTKFFKCSFGEKVPQDCPFMKNGERLRYNKYEQVCDWPWNVDCMRVQPIARVATFSAILPVPTECPAHESMEYTVHLPDETDCTKFFKCSFGEKVPQDCPFMNNGERLRYNKYEQVCDWPRNVDCSPGPTTLPPPYPTTKPTPYPTTKPTPYPTTKPTPLPKTTANPGVEGCIKTCPNDDPPNKITALAHGDCRKWCRCENKVVKVYVCPANFYFSPTLEKCTDPALAGCTGAK